MSLIKKLKYTWPFIAGWLLLILLYFFKSFAGQYVILYGLIILFFIPVLTAFIQGKNGISYALAGLVLGALIGLAIGSYTGEHISEIIFKSSIKDVGSRPDLVIWNFLLCSVLASLFAVVGGKIGRNKNETSDLHLLIIGTIITLTSVILFSDHLLIKAVGTVFGMYLAFKGGAKLSKKHAYLFKQPWNK